MSGQERWETDYRTFSLNHNSWTLRATRQNECYLEKFVYLEDSEIILQIIYSKLYQMPILYFIPHTGPTRCVVDISKHFLKITDFKLHLSWCTHPHTNLPAIFLHTCDLEVICKSFKLWTTFMKANINFFVEQM